MIDDWRYVTLSTWQVDMISSYDPTDEYISHLDGDHLIEGPEFKDPDELLSILSSPHLDIIKLYMFEKLTFQQIGNRFGFSRQWTHRLYWDAIKILKETYPDISSLYREESDEEF